MLCVRFSTCLGSGLWLRQTVCAIHHPDVMSPQRVLHQPRDCSSSFFCRQQVPVGLCGRAANLLMHDGARSTSDPIPETKDALAGISFNKGLEILKS